MSQKVYQSPSVGKIEVINEEFNLEKEKQNLKDDEFLAKIIYSPMMDLIYFYIHGQVPIEYPFNIGIEASGQIVYAKDATLIGKYVNFYTDKSGSWKQFSKGSLQLAIILEDCKDEEDLKNFAGACYANPITAVGLVESALSNPNVKCVVNTAAGSSLAHMIHKILKSKGVETINIIRSSSKVEKLKQALQSENVIATDSPNFNQDLANLIAKYQPSIVLDALGGDTSGQYLKLLPFGSKMIIYSILSGSTQLTVDLGDTLTNHKKIEGFYVNAWLLTLTPEEYQKAHEYVQKNYREFFSIPISKVFPLEQAEDALNYFMANTSLGKVLISNK